MNINECKTSFRFQRHTLTLRNKQKHIQMSIRGCAGCKQPPHSGPQHKDRADCVRFGVWRMLPHTHKHTHTIVTLFPVNQLISNCPDKQLHASFKLRDLTMKFRNRTLQDLKMLLLCFHCLYI